MKGFIIVARQHAGEVLMIMRNAAAGAAAVDAYSWLKQQLSNKGVSHKDQTASHQSQLQHQGDYVSFYIGPDGRWTQIEH